MTVRARPLASLLLALLALTAGCSTGMTSGSAPEGTAPSAVPGTTAAASSTGTPTATPTERPPSRLSLTLDAAVPVTLVVVAVPGGAEVVNGTYDPVVVRPDLRGALEPGEAYHVTVRVDGERRWDRRLRPTERLRLVVTREGTVRVVDRTAA